MCRSKMSSLNALKSSEASLQPESVSWFVSDLHLAPERPAATGRFFRFLDARVRGADALYILGDLFDSWVGDDDLDASIAHDTAERLRTLAASGTAVYFMHGNRDFLLAGRYAQHAGMTLIPDPTVIALAGVPTLLMHGDTLCTDDIGYQRFRRITRLAWVKKLLVALPMPFKRCLAGQARAGSEAAKRDKPAAIMDVHPDAVAAALRRANAGRLIHGHTHRPARHVVELDDHTCERWVLSDWYGDAATVLRCDASGCQPETV